MGSWAFVSTSASNQWEGEGKLGVSIPPVRRFGGSLDATSGSSPFLVAAATQLLKFKGPSVVNPPLMGLWAEQGFHHGRFSGRESLKKELSHPLRLFGGFVTGNFRGRMPENHSSHNHRVPHLPRVEAHAIPRFEEMQLLHIEVPSIFQIEDKAFHISNGKLGNGSAGPAEENIFALDILLQNPSSM